MMLRIKAVASRIRILTGFLSSSGRSLSKSRSPAPRLFRACAVGGGMLFLSMQVLVIAAGCSEPLEETVDQPHAMSKAQAIAQAGSQIGFPHYDDTKVEAAMVQLRDQSLPFLTEELAGRRTWRIEFSDSPLHEHAKKRLPKNGYVKDLVVFLSPDTHQVMKVVSRWPEGVPRIAPYPPCAEEERQ